MNTLLIFIKWTVIVWLNAIVSFILAVDLDKASGINLLAMICGVFTFVFIYTAVDLYLIKIDKQNLRKSLFISALIKALTQFYPMIEMITGILAINAVDIVIGNITFLTIYLTTVLDGILLSIIVAILKTWHFPFSLNRWRILLKSCSLFNSNRTMQKKIVISTPSNFHIHKVK